MTQPHMYLKEIDNNNPSQTIYPSPILVIKSKFLSPPKYSNLKLFINLCHHNKIPPPNDPFDPLTTFNKIMNNQWEIPILVSPMRYSHDKMGKECLVLDCIINSQCVNDLNRYTDLKDIVVEWCLESLEISENNAVIDRDQIKFPKVVYKDWFKGETNNTWPMELQSSNNIDTPKHEQETFSQWKEDLLYKQELENENNQLKTLFPQDNNHQQQSSLLIQDITNERTINKQTAIKPPLTPPPVPQHMDLLYNVSMRKTNNTTNYKLRIQIDFNSNQSTTPWTLSQIHLKSIYDPIQNNLIISNDQSSLFNSNKIILPLPNLYNNNKLSYINNLILFWIKNQNKLIIFI